MVLIQDKDAMSMNSPPQYEDVMGPQRTPSQVPTSHADATSAREVLSPLSMPSPTLPQQVGPYPPHSMPIPQHSPYPMPGAMQGPQVTLNPEAQIGYNYQHERECLFCK